MGDERRGVGDRRRYPSVYPSSMGRGQLCRIVIQTKLIFLSRSSFQIYLNNQTFFRFGYETTQNIQFDGFWILETRTWFIYWSGVLKNGSIKKTKLGHDGFLFGCQKSQIFCLDIYEIEMSGVRIDVHEIYMMWFLQTIGFIDLYFVNTFYGAIKIR